MNNFPTIFFLAKYAIALCIEIDVVLKGTELIEVINNEQV